MGSVTAGWTQTESVTNSFNLEQCVQYALEHNQLVLNKALDKEIAETQVGETLSMGLPQVSISGGVNYNYEVQKSLIDASNFDPTVPAGTEAEFAFGQAYDGNLNLQAKQLIFDGSFFVGMQAARTYRELSNKDHIKTKIDVVEAVSKAYYNALITGERLVLVEVNFTRLDTLLRDTEALFINGFVEKIDVSRLKVQFNNLTVERNKLKQFAKISNDLLKFQMGMALAETLEIQDSLDKISFQTVEEAVADFNYSNRIEYSQLQTNMSLTQLDMKNNRVQYIPTLYANFNYGYNTATAESGKLFNSDRWLNYGALGMSLNIPVFDGFLKKNRIQKNKIQVQQIQQSMEMTGNSIDLEIRQSKVNLNSAIENMAAQNENMELAEEVFNVTRIKYEEGVGSNSEVLDADTALKESQTNYYNALFDALIAKIDLQKAYGTLLKKDI
jgi:outer membrane protein TolC